eukprot:5960110-Ditylum_brightwellii.AAC.1
MGSGFAITKEVAKKVVKGQCCDKNRAMHNLSFEKREGILVNQRARMEKLKKCIYGFAFLRQLYYMHYLCSKCPNKTSWQ